MKGVAEMKRHPRLRQGGWLAATTAVVIAIVVMVNLIVGELPTHMKEFDLSGNQLYTVSDASKEFLAGLDEDVEIVVLAEPSAVDRRVSKFLDNYAALSDRVTLTQVDPVAHPSAAEEYGASAGSIIVRCGGTGKIVETPCKTCDGKGRVRRHKSIEVTVPAGIDDEQILNVGGKGNAGVNGGPNGDLHVYVSVRPHPLFERRGNDVWCEMPITFTQAALGADVEVPTLDGKVSYHVHEGTQPGDVFRLKGKGIQGLGSRMRGDQYVQVTVEVPRNLSKRQKEILAELDKASDDKNYAKRKSFFGKLKDLFGE